MKKESIFIGILYYINSCILFGICMAIYTSIQHFVPNDFEISYFLWAVLFWSLISIVFSGAGAVLIGAPVSIILAKLGFFNYYVTTILGALIGVLISFAFFKELEWFIVIYSSIGAFGFWLGVSNHEKAKPLNIVITPNITEITRKDFKS